MYQYRAIVRRVYDGDTIWLDVDLGMETWLTNQVIRLHDVWAPEVRGPERPIGLTIRDALRERLPIGKTVTIDTHKDSRGKYGRWIADIHDDDGSVNEWLRELIGGG